MIVSVDGADLFYETRGVGPSCLVLSAIGATPYERMMPAQLSDRLTLIFVELRGCGRSTGNPAGLSFDVLANDLEAIRTQLGVERVAVLGHSILGALAVEYARRRPDSVSHAILVGTPPRGDMAVLAQKAAAFFEADASDERKRILRDNLAALPPEASPGQAMFAHTPMRFCDPGADAAPLFAGADVKPRFFQHLMGPLTRDWDITVDPGSLRVPLLMAHGRYDYTVPYTLWEEVLPRLPDATLHLFERSGHQPFLEEPDRFAEAVGSWMADRSS